MGVNQDPNLLSLTRQKLKMGPNDGCIPLIYFFIFWCVGAQVFVHLFFLSIHKFMNCQLDACLEPCNLYGLPKSAARAHLGWGLGV